MVSKDPQRPSTLAPGWFLQGLRYHQICFIDIYILWIETVQNVMLMHKLMRIHIVFLLKAITACLTQLWSVTASPCGKVMFSQTCVKNSVGGVCMAGGRAWQGACMVGVHTRGCMAVGVCVCGRWACMAEVCVGVCAWQGMCMARGHAWQGGMRCGVEGMCGGRGAACKRDSHCSGWYASYWNAFFWSVTVSPWTVNANYTKRSQLSFMRLAILSDLEVKFLFLNFCRYEIFVEDYTF